MAEKEEKAVKEKNNENKVKKHFFKDFKAELKKVIWPTPKQLINNTVAVVVIVVIVCALVFALDAVFEAVNKYGITELQSYVVEQLGNPEEESENEDDHDHESEDTTSESTTSTENTASEENTTADSGNGTESNQ